MRKKILLALLALPCGCAQVQGPAPVGSQAIKMDLKPWLAGAPTVTFTGWLQNFYVFGSLQPDEYATWAIHSSLRDCAEVDVRRCEASAQRLVDQRVTIRGRLLEREGYHRPLLVAESIEPAMEPSNLAAAGQNTSFGVR